MQDKSEVAARLPDPANPSRRPTGLDMLKGSAAGTREPSLTGSRKHWIARLRYIIDMIQVHISRPALKVIEVYVINIPWA